jgi:hypothetical protein
MLEWVDHIWRSKGLAKNIFTGRLNGKRPRGSTKTKMGGQSENGSYGNRRRINKY